MNRWLIDQTWCTYSTKQSPALKRRVFPTNSDAADGSRSAKRESRPYTVHKNWIMDLRVKCKVTMTVEDGRGEDLGNTNMNISYQYDMFILIWSYWVQNQAEWTGGVGSQGATAVWSPQLSLHQRAPLTQHRSRNWVASCVSALWHPASGFWLPDLEVFLLHKSKSSMN